VLAACQLQKHPFDSRATEYYNFLLVMTIHKAVKGLHAVYIFLFLLNYIQRKFLATWLKIRAEPLKIWRSWWLSWLSLAVVASYVSHW